MPLKRGQISENGNIASGYCQAIPLCILPKIGSWAESAHWKPALPVQGLFLILSFLAPHHAHAPNDREHASRIPFQSYPAVLAAPPPSSSLVKKPPPLALSTRAPYEKPSFRSFMLTNR